MQKIIQERIIRSEEHLLSELDRSNLVTKRNKQVVFLLSSYIPLALILVYVFVNGLTVIYRDKYPYPKHEIDEDDINRFALVAPYVCGFFFLMLTGYFIYYYLQSTAPLIKDLNKGKKFLLYMRPEKTEMPFFSKYYISTPIPKKQLVQIDKEDFHNITDDNSLILELAPHSEAILRIVNKGKEIKYY